MYKGKRAIKDIVAEYDKYWDKVWWNRHMAGGEPEVGRASARAVEDEWGKEFLQPGTELEWGITLGKMMALAWVLGAEWDEAGDT